MDFFPNMYENSPEHQEQQTNQPLKTQQPNTFSSFAKSLGIASVFCAAFSIFYGTFIAGGLAIVLALLSKGNNPKMDRRAKIGIATASIALILQTVLFVTSIYSILYIPEYRQQFNTLYEQMYGESVEESIESILDNINLSDF